MTPVSRRALLGGLAATACSPRPGERAQLPPPTGAPTWTVPIARPRNLLIVQAYGGWDTTYSIDPKPDSDWMDLPLGDVQTFGGLPIWTHTTRPNTAAFFERHHERVGIIHGINVRSVDHTQCLRWMLTGTRDPRAPDVCAIAASVLGRDLPIPYLLMSDRAFLGPFGDAAARAGGTNQIAALADPAQRFPPLDGTVGLDPTDGEQAAIDAWRAARRDAPVGALGGAVAAREDAPRARVRARGLREVAEWLGLAGVPQDLDGQIETATSILEGGLARTVMMDSLAYFDTHGRNEIQVDSQEATFLHLTALFDALAERPGREGGSLFDETVVAVVSEMGRSGVLNEREGKDHWPFASVLVAGAGIGGDLVHGATDEAFLGVDVEGGPLVAERFVAGLLAATGVDPSEWLPGVRPFHGFYRA